MPGQLALASVQVRGGLGGMGSMASLCGVGGGVNWGGAAVRSSQL